MIVGQRDERKPRSGAGRRAPATKHETSLFRIFSTSIARRALSLLAEHGADAKPLAGGQSLIPAMNFSLATPSILVDLNASELTQIKDDSGDLRIGGWSPARIERSSLCVGPRASYC